MIFGIVKEKHIEICHVAEKERNDRLASKVSWLSIALMGEGTFKSKSWRCSNFYSEKCQVFEFVVFQFFEPEKWKIIEPGANYFKNINVTFHYNVSKNK